MSEKKSEEEMIARMESTLPKAPANVEATWQRKWMLGNLSIQNFCYFVGVLVALVWGIGRYTASTAAGHDATEVEVQQALKGVADLREQHDAERREDEAWKIEVSKNIAVILSKLDRLDDPNQPRVRQ